MHRFYDAGSARWISRDPVGLEGGTNTYSYCDGNPVMYGDPSGFAKIILYYYEVFGTKNLRMLTGPVPGLFGDITGHHMGIAIEANGKILWSFAGGPENFGFGTGKLISKSGPWKDKTMDFRMLGGDIKNAVGSIVLFDDAKTSASTLVRMFQTYEKEMKEDNPLIEYNPIGDSNSNSWSRELLERSNLLGAYNKAKAKRIKAGKGWPWSPSWESDPWQGAWFWKYPSGVKHYSRCPSSKW